MVHIDLCGHGAFLSAGKRLVTVSTAVFFRFSLIGQPAKTQKLRYAQGLVVGIHQQADHIRRLILKCIPALVYLIHRLRICRRNFIILLIILFQCVHQSHHLALKCIQLS